ncbi:MAG: TldD/PmbA family protein, partial [Gemmatimonadetes bacterium]|nr:TldD/PmbA family protein [Gemmatimonadota bacterium]
MKRREFLLHGAAATAALGAGSAILPRLAAAAPTDPMDPAASRELSMRALEAARAAGASYADVRISGNRSQALGTRERQITFFNDAESTGFGVRVIVNGAWGFAASREVNADEVVRVARQAAAQARANSAARQRPLELAPVETVPNGRWSSPLEIDPFNVPIEEKVDLLLRANTEALKVNGARFVTSSMNFLRIDKTFASTDGSYIEQTLYRSYPQMNITAVGEGGDFQSRASTDVAPRGMGYEHVRDANLPGNAGRWAEEAVRKLTAKPVEPGRYDLVLLPTHLWLTIHESIAHPTELDRIMGFEANYAGTSFIHPVSDYLGKFRYGRDFMNIQGERSTPGGLSSIGWDDEGVKPDEYLIVKNGILNDLQTTREQAPMLADWYRQTGKPVRSHGNSYAQNWNVVQFQRMPNVNLLPHPTRDVPLDELIGGVENGILIDGDGSFSIDQQRY